MISKSRGVPMGFWYHEDGVGGSLGRATQSGPLEALPLLTKLHPANGLLLTAALDPPPSSPGWDSFQGRVTTASTLVSCSATVYRFRPTTPVSTLIR